jgi:hypothetical protein
LNISFIYLATEPIENGFECRGFFIFNLFRTDNESNLKGIALFPAVFSYPQDPTLNHMPGIINIIQSRHFHHKSRILPIFNKTSSVTGSIPIGDHVKFYDSLLDVTYFLYRIDRYIVISVIHDSLQDQFEDNLALIKELDKVFFPKDLLK